MISQMDELVGEFTGRTNNEAYELAFTKRLMRPDPDDPTSFLGNTQRQDFIPYLKELLNKLKPSPQIFDIGAGAGEIVDIILKDLNDAVFNVVEPNPILLAQYKKRVGRYPNLKLGVCHSGPVQDYYSDLLMSPPVPESRQDLVLAVHMVYHLTDLHTIQVNPDADIKAAIATMYKFLKDDGYIFIVFADQLVSTTGQASRYYFKNKGQQASHDNHLEIAKSRIRLLHEDGIIKLLDVQYPESSATIYSIMTDSYLYGDSPADLVAMCLTAEIGESNDEPFDIEKLELCAQFFEENAKNIGLTIEERNVAQKGMYRANQPQIVSVIRRTKRI